MLLGLLLIGLILIPILAFNNCNNTIYDIVSNSTDHTSLKTAIDASGLDGLLSGPGPFTLYASTDASGTFTTLLNDIPELTQILQHHIVNDSVTTNMFLDGQTQTTRLGTNLTVSISSGNAFIDNEQITVSDIIASNGVVHVISK